MIFFCVWLFLGSIQMAAEIFWRIQKKYLKMDTSTLAKENTLQVWDQSLQMIFQLLVSHVICSSITYTIIANQFQKPFIGQSIVPNLYVITGHGSKGWTLSFGSFALLADIIDGKSTQVWTVFFDREYTMVLRDPRSWKLLLGNFCK